MASTKARLLKHGFPVHGRTLTRAAPSPNAALRHVGRESEVPLPLWLRAYPLCHPFHHHACPSHAPCPEEELPSLCPWHDGLEDALGAKPVAHEEIERSSAKETNPEASEPLLETNRAVKDLVEPIELRSSAKKSVKKVAFAALKFRPWC